MAYKARRGEEAGEEGVYSVLDIQCGAAVDWPKEGLKARNEAIVHARLDLLRRQGGASRGLGHELPFCPSLLLRFLCLGLLGSLVRGRDSGERPPDGMVRDNLPDLPFRTAL